MACAAALLAKAVMGPLARLAAQGLAAAWAVSTASVAALVFTRPVSLRAFWIAFGAGMFLRASVMGALMVWVWGARSEQQGALLGAYALGVLFLLLLEYKNLVRE